jgi:hypothetical protein
VAHTVTYFLVGLVAFAVLDYARKFAQTDLRLLMRQAGDPLVMAGPLFQPARGVLFGAALYPLRTAVLGGRRGWLVLWGALVAFGVLGTFGPAPGSLEGLIYTTLRLRTHLEVLPEVVLQALALSVTLWYWVNHQEKKWISWTLGVAFVLVLLLPAVGLLVGPARVPGARPGGGG